MHTRVLVTGGTGFMGRWMEATQPANVEAYYYSRADYEAVKMWSHEQYDSIVHLAPVDPGPVLKYAQKHETRVLYVSSGAVYGELPNYYEYAYDKKLWELQCTTSNVDCVIARPFAFVGAWLPPLYAVSRFIQAARAGRPLEVWGDGLSVRSYLYGEDLGRWLWRILSEGAGIYDIGGKVPYTILQVANIVSELTGAPVKVLNNGYPPTRYLPDLTRANELGCVETVGLRDAIERTLKDE